MFHFGVERIRSQTGKADHAEQKTDPHDWNARWIRPKCLILLSSAKMFNSRDEENLPLLESLDHEQLL